MGCTPSPDRRFDLISARRKARALTGLLAPPRCLTCDGCCRHDERLCDRCAAAIELAAPRRVELPGLDVAWARAPYVGTPRRLVTALKFRSLHAASTVIAREMAEWGPAWLEGEAITSVPPAPLRERRRGYDQASWIAAKLAAELDQTFTVCMRRTESGRQRGRSRAERLESPMRPVVDVAVPSRIVLVDDVVTTGATLAACARALRGAGAEWVGAVVMCRA